MPHVSKTKQIEPKTHKPNPAPITVDHSKELLHSPTIPEQVVHLQRIIGNRQTTQLVGTPIQRLMSLQNFKASTDIGSKPRFKIKPLDWAISGYHRLRINNYAGRSAKLATITNRAQHYLNLPDHKAKRKDGVNRLLPHIVKEKEVIDFLVSYAGAGSLKLKYDELNKAQDSVNEAEALGYDVDRLYLHIDDEVRKLIVEIRKKDPEVLKEIVRDDRDKLQTLAKDPNIPAITRNMLNEVLGNVDDINLIEDKPGARHTNDEEKKQGVTEKYTIAHSLMQAGGTSERLGALTHELTHISSAESYDNTPLYMLFPKTMSEEDLIQLATTRKNDVLALQNLYKDDIAFSPKQKAMIGDKLKYALERKLGLYVARFSEKKKIDGPTVKKLLKVDSAVHENNTLIEFDSVVNQCLIYMHQWGIPQENPFYVKLMQVAQTAYQARANARN